jgi:hypothetical protein
MDLAVHCRADSFGQGWGPVQALSSALGARRPCGCAFEVGTRSADRLFSYQGPVVFASYLKMLQYIKLVNSKNPLGI